MLVCVPQAINVFSYYCGIAHKGIGWTTIIHRIYQAFQIPVKSSTSSREHIPRAPVLVRIL